MMSQYIEKKSRVRRKLATAAGAAVLIIGSLVATSNSAQAVTPEPCDIYSSAGTSCVAAYSSVRALYSGYNGSLYQVTRASDSTTRDIGLLAAGDYANAATQDAFCSGTTCIITKIYDQSPQHNDLTIEGPGTAVAQMDNGAVANALPITAGGHSVYGIYMPPGTGYRRVTTTGVATGSSPESMYMIASGTNVNNNCCSDFGNVEHNNNDTGAGHMDAVTVGLYNTPGSTGHGPWVQADLENGVFQGGTAVYTGNTGNSSKFVTALLKNNGTTSFTLKGGNSQTGTLRTQYSGSLPSGYAPMHLEGSIVLGTGGDNSNWAPGSFFEGVMTSGFSTDAADDSIQANIVSVGYAANSTGGGPGSTIVGPAGKCVNVDGSDTGGNGAAITLWDCNALDADQHWSPSALGNGTIATLGRCLDVIGNSTAAGAKLQLYDCNGVAGQQWIPQENGSILNPQSGLCLDDPSGNTANGTQLQIWTCNGLTPQVFKITAGTPIILSSGNKCINVDGADNGVNGAAVNVWDCHTIATAAAFDRDHQWTVNADQSIRTLGRCLDIINNGNTAGANLQIWDCNGHAGQKWVPQSNGSLLNPGSGLCLDDPSGNTANGTQLQIWTCNGLTPQVFRIN
jgi:hypothetical protein